MHLDSSIRRSTGRRGHLSEGDGHAARGPLRHEPGCGRRHRALAGRRTGPGLPGKRRPAHRPLAPPSSNLDLRRRSRGVGDCHRVNHRRGCCGPRPAPRGGSAPRPRPTTTWPGKPSKTISTASARTRCSRSKIPSISAACGASCSRQRCLITASSSASMRMIPSCSQLAETQFRVGQIMRELGSPDAAISAFNAAIAIWEAASRRLPGDHDLPVRLAQSLQALGEQYAAIRKFPPALAALGRSPILKTLADEPAADSSLRTAWPVCDKELGIAEGEDGKPDAGLEPLNEAESILRRCCRARPATRDIASCWPTRSTRRASSISSAAIATMHSGRSRSFTRSVSPCSTTRVRIASPPSSSTHWR